MGNLIDLTGKQFGMLTVLSRRGSRQGKAMWECLCDCGRTATIPTGDLNSGKSKSCGCTRTIHGSRNTRLYRIWSGMKTRCYNTSDHLYGLYGARGITVCTDWLDSFDNFRDWAVANGYQEHLALDRKETNGSYSPDNCRWATMKEQENNRRNNRHITYAGKTQTLAQWADETGIHRSTIQYRLNHGWDVERALTTKGG